MRRCEVARVGLKWVRQKIDTLDPSNGPLMKEVTLYQCLLQFYGSAYININLYHNMSQCILTQNHRSCDHFFLANDDNHPGLPKYPLVCIISMDSLWPDRWDSKVSLSLCLQGIVGFLSPNPLDPCMVCKCHTHTWKTIKIQPNAGTYTIHGPNGQQDIVFVASLLFWNDIFLKLHSQKLR